VGGVRARESSLAEASPIGGLGGGLDWMVCFVTTAKNCCSDHLERGSEFVQGGTHLVLRLHGLSGLESQKEKKRHGKNHQFKARAGRESVPTWVVYLLQHGMNQGHHETGFYKSTRGDWPYEQLLARTAAMFLLKRVDASRPW
jgi:hypothetical protein